VKTIVKLTLALLSAATFFTAVAPAGAAESSSGTVNVNTASAEQLALLPRVGPALAAKIIDHREENGPFKQAEDLLLVSGIGDKMFGLIEPFVRTSGETTLKQKIKAGSLAKPDGGKAKGAPAKAGGGEEKATPAAEGAAEEGR
jgi:competence protein ComEA